MVSIDDLNEQLREIKAKAEQLLSSLDTEQVGRRPNPAKWSIAECLAHLNLTAAVAQPLAEKAIQLAKEKKVSAKGPFPLGAVGTLFTWIAEPPPRFRMWAPKKIAPKVDAADVSQVTAEFMRCHSEWERLVQQAADLDMARAKVRSPFPGLPRFRLSGFFSWMFAHERRHLLQAENIRKMLAGLG